MDFVAFSTNPLFWRLAHSRIQQHVMCLGWNGIASRLCCRVVAGVNRRLLHNSLSYRCSDLHTMETMLMSQICQQHAKQIVIWFAVLAKAHQGFYDERALWKILDGKERQDILSSLTPRTHHTVRR